MSLPAMPRRPLTVSELNRRVCEWLQERFAGVWLVGEITGLRRPSSGHVYMGLKDDRAQITAVMWRGPASRLPFDLRDGLEVVVQGRLTLYEPRGQYQIVLDRVQPKGVGALQLAFQQMKEKLEAEGLFDADRKRPIPSFPKRIGVVTSPTGAAVRDIIETIRSRFPGARVLLRPSNVQGKAAAAQIADAIADLNRIPDVDVMIVGRGGGSLEDLWPFNEEIVARAIAASRIPVVSAVGHEIDVTISDLVADRRALTPTDAGRIVAPDMSRLAGDLSALAGRLAQGLRSRVERERERLDGLARSYAFRRPLDQVRRLEQRVDELGQRLARVASTHFPALRRTIEALDARLRALSPESVLRRGYSITFHADGGPLRGAAEARPGETVRTRLQDGEFTSTVLK